MLEQSKVTGLNRIAPQLEDGECNKTNGLNLYAGRNCIIMGRAWWLVKMGIRELDARMAVIAVIELVTLCVMVSVDDLNPVDEITIE